MNTSEFPALFSVSAETLGSKKALTLPWVILSHLHLFNTFCREPASSSFHGSFPKATFTNTQHWGKKETGT